jgi:hypothetical protein
MPPAPLTNTDNILRLTWASGFDTAVQRNERLARLEILPTSLHPIWPVTVKHQFCHVCIETLSTITHCRHQACTRLGLFHWQALNSNYVARNLLEATFRLALFVGSCITLDAITFQSSCHTHWHCLFFSNFCLLPPFCFTCWEFPWVLVQKPVVHRTAAPEIISKVH